MKLIEIYQYSIYLIFSTIVIVVQSSSSHSQDSPTASPTTSYHFENKETYEFISIAALSIMLFVLLTAFFGGWYISYRNNLKQQQQQQWGESASTHGIALDISNRSSFSSESSSMDSSSQYQQSIHGNSTGSTLDKFQLAMELYVREHGDRNVGADWVVPDVHPWPKELWGFELGKCVRALKGVFATPPAKPDKESASTISASPASQSNHESSQHQPETWYELFYDLVFVAAALQLGMVIKYDHRLLGLLKASVLFLMLRSTWDHVTMYQNR